MGDIKPSLRSGQHSGDVASPAPPKGPAPLHVFRWDLDKTYLRTEFATMRDLVRSALERAEDKQAVPGASALLRELRRLDGARVCFISGSPQQMRRVLTRKLQLDGVEFDEFILKQNLRNLLRGRFRALREQVGYKLPALLAGRAVCTPDTRETCFGDDAEADAFVYSLYADLLAGKVGLPVVEEVLALARAYPDDAARTLELASKLERSPAVARIFIHLDRRSPTASFHRYGRRLVPIYNYFQAGMVLLEDAVIGAAALVNVASEMVEKFGYSVLALVNSVEDLRRRGRVDAATVERFAVWCREAPAPILSDIGARLAALGGVITAPPPPDTPIDYVATFLEDHPQAWARYERKRGA